MFETLDALPADAILGLMAEFNADPREQKLDLGVGVYRSADGITPILECVKKAERRLVDEQQTKTYLGTAGAVGFNAAMQRLTFADSADSDRLCTVQTPGGSGSLRVAASLLKKAAPGRPVWVSEPTWNNHVPLLGGAGLELKSYAYYDTDRHVIRTEAMLDALGKVPKGDVVLFHTCCHNPSGLDPGQDDWRAIADVVLKRELVPFFDTAYQGFADGLDEDVFAVRLMAERVPEMIVTNSCSKNFGLYRDRVGVLAVLSGDKAAGNVVRSHLSYIARTIYSMPPDHGAAVVEKILNDASLSAEWHEELAAMRARIADMRNTLHAALKTHAPEHDFSHLLRARGMFCFLGITPEQIDVLKRDYGIYMVGSSRINVAGMNADNADYLASSIAAVL